MDDIKLFVKYRKEIESLVYTANIFFEDICMDIATFKCNVVAVSCGHLVYTEDILCHQEIAFYSWSQKELIGILEFWKQIQLSTSS